MIEFDFKKIKGIFFDLYGTVLVFKDEEKASKEWRKAFYNRVGIENNFSEETINIICEELLLNNINKESGSGLTTYQTKIKRSFEKRGVSFTREQLAFIADETVGIWQRHISLAPDATDVFTELKKRFKMAMITNFDHTPHIKKVIKDYNLDSFLNPIIISDEVGFLKPDSRIFELTLKQVNLKAEEIIFVGDSSDDISGAIFSNIEPVLIKYPQSRTSINLAKDRKKPIEIIHSLTGLINLLNNN